MKTCTFHCVDCGRKMTSYSGFNKADAEVFCEYCEENPPGEGVDEETTQPGAPPMITFKITI